MNIAIILAGGIGSRVGADRPKQFIEVLDRPILAYTIDRFEEHKDIDAIVVVCVKEYLDNLIDFIKKEGYKKIFGTVCGGSDFQRSVISGINYLNGIASTEDIILIHYGASPFVDQEIISDAIRVCKRKGNASPAKKLISLSARSDLCDSTAKALNRDEVVCLNSPQALRYGYVRNLYEKAISEGVIDKVDPHTTSLMLAFGERVFYSLDKTSNIKITTKEDIDLFEAWVIAHTR